VADIVTEEKKVKAIEWQQHLQKTVRVKKTELDAKKRVIDEKNAAHEADDVAAYSVERQQKATFALQEAMKGVEKLKDGKGLHAESDRNKAVSMLAKLRIAHAYSAKKLIGLEPKLQKDPCLDLLRSSVELATGVPTKTHIAMAKQQLRMTVDCRKKESYGKVDRENARVKKNMDDEIMANKKAADRKIRTDREAQLRIQEKAGKTDDNLYEYKIQYQRQRAKDEKWKMVEVRKKWLQHEERETKHITNANKVRQLNMERDELVAKNLKKVRNDGRTRMCAVLTEHHMAAMEFRNKALSGFKKARENLIVAKDLAAGVKPYDSSKEAPNYKAKGNECCCKEHMLISVQANDADACKAACTEKTANCQAVNYYPNTKKCELLKPGSGAHQEVAQSGGPPDPNCNLYYKFSGPGSEGHGEGDEMRLLGESSKFAQAVFDKLNTKKYGEETAQIRAQQAHDAKWGYTPQERKSKFLQTTAELTGKANKEDADRKEVKAKADAEASGIKERDLKIENSHAANSEGSQKKLAQDQSLGVEKSAKKSLEEEVRQMKNKEEKVDEANNKLADADVQQRHCETSLVRRRRTCACDDVGEVPMLDVPALVPEGELGDASQTQAKAKDKFIFLAAAAVGAAEGMHKSHERKKKAAEELKNKEQDEKEKEKKWFANSGNERQEKLARRRRDNWERRRYVRRRYVKPTANDRRRRYAFPEPPKPRIPAAICPCPAAPQEEPEAPKEEP